MTQDAVLVWGEIPVSNLPRAIEFYRNVFGFDIQLDETGPTPQAILGIGAGGVGAHLFEGEPAPGAFTPGDCRFQLVGKGEVQERPGAAGCGPARPFCLCARPGWQ